MNGAVLAGSWASIPTATCVFVAITDREEFDKLDRPVTDHRTTNTARKVLTKTVEADGVMVVFQHWLDDTGAPA